MHGISRLKKLYESTKQSCGAGVYFDNDKKRYIKYQCGGRSYRKSLRKLSNRKYRRMNDVMKHSGYKKVFDYYWNLL